MKKCIETIGRIILLGAVFLIFTSCENPVDPNGPENPIVNPENKTLTISFNAASGADLVPTNITNGQVVGMDREIHNIGRVARINTDDLIEGGSYEVSVPDHAAGDYGVLFYGPAKDFNIKSNNVILEFGTNTCTGNVEVYVPTNTYSGVDLPIDKFLVELPAAVENSTMPNITGTKGAQIRNNSYGTFRYID